MFNRQSFFLKFSLVCQMMTFSQVFYRDSKEAHLKLDKEQFKNFDEMEMHAVHRSVTSRPFRKLSQID